MKHEAPRMREGAPHWRGAREQKLMVPYCARCVRYQWPATRACRACGEALEWRASTGRATVASYSVVRRAVDPALKDEVPYLVAFVVLDEGVRLFTNLVDVQADAVHCGMRVRCRFEPTTDDEAWVPVFSPGG